MIRFAYSLIAVGFRTISKSFFCFLSQTTYPGECLRPEVVLSRSYLRKCSIWPPLSSIYHFLKMPENLNRLELEAKIHEVRVPCPRWFNMELPNEEFYPLRNRCYDHCKNVFYPFSEQQLSGKHISSSKSCNLSVQAITEKMESNR